MVSRLLCRPFIKTMRVCVCVVYTHTHILLIFVKDESAFLRCKDASLQISSAGDERRRMQARRQRKRRRSAAIDVDRAARARQLAD